MGTPNFANRTLYHGDNLPFLRGMNSETVHLIATDPPFNKNKDFAAAPSALAALLIERNGMVCAGCDREFDDPLYLELDHNTPRSDGGVNHISNRLLLCGPCNRIKSNMLTLSGLRRENARRSRMAKGS